MSDRTILVLSALKVWSLGANKGAQSLYKTLKYLNTEFKVEFFSNTISKEEQIPDLNNIKLTKINCFSLEKTFTPNHKLHSFRFIIFPFWWFVFQIRSFYAIRKKIKENSHSILYAYEVSAVPVMKFLSKIYTLPLVTRFQGTILYPLLHKKIRRLLQFHHYIALKITSDLLIMTNDGTKGDIVLKKLHNRSKKILFWLNGVTPPKLPTEEAIKVEKLRLHISKESKILVTISRLVFWKRVDRSINIVKKMSDQSVHLIIVGDGPDRERLKKLAQIANNIHFVGAIPHDNIGLYYALADVFLSLYSLSNVGNPLLEAMSIGKPIVTLNNGDTKTIIKNGENGILVNENDVNQIYKNILTLLRDNKKRKILSENAKNFAQIHFWGWSERMQKEIDEIKLLKQTA